MAPLRQEDPRARRATTPTSCSSTRAAPTMGASVFAVKRGGTVVTCAATSGYMVEFDNRHFWMKLKNADRLALRELRRGVGGQPADRPGPHPAAAVRACTRSTDRRGRARRSTATRPRASSACCASHPQKASASTTPRSASASARTRSPSSAPDGRRARPAHCCDERTGGGAVGHGRHDRRHRALLVRVPSASWSSRSAAEWPEHHAKAVVGFDLLKSAAYIKEHTGIPIDEYEIVERMLDGVIARLERAHPVAAGRLPAARRAATTPACRARW